MRNDASRYFCGKIQNDQNEITIVASAASDKGLAGAAIAATKMIFSFRPRFLSMIGICAGVKGRTGIGDVVFADPCWDWGSGKIKQDARGREIFLPAPYQMRMDETVRSQVIQFSEKHKSMLKEFENFTGKKPRQPPKVRLGVVASGASVLQSSQTMLKILGQHKDLLALEMEIFSVMYAAHIAPLPRPKCFALKSVCDFADQKKGDAYQKYAATMSAKAFEEFVLYLFKAEYTEGSEEARLTN